MVTKRKTTPRRVKCECCSETKQLNSELLNGWWAVRQKGGGFETRPLKTGDLKPQERAACGVGHLMILCERAASGTLDKTVYYSANNGDDRDPPPTAFVEAPDDLPPDPTVTPEPEIPMLAEEARPFHLLPLLVRLVNRHMRPPLDDFPFPEPEAVGVLDERTT